MEKVKARDHTAFEELFHRHGRATYGYCMRALAGNRASTEDINQEVWLKVIARAATYRAEGNFKAWLMTITRNEMVTLLRKRIPASDLRDEEDGVESVPSSFNLEEAYLDAEKIEAVKEAMDALPDSHRLALTLWNEGDTTYEAIAAVIGTTPGTVRSMLFRARQALKKRLEKK